MILPRLLPALFAVAGLVARPTLAKVHAPGPAEAVRFLSPAPEDELTAGEMVTLAWAPGPEFARLGAVEEWEAFFSLDGGERFPFRLTPHLDLANRRVLVRLPELPTDDGRLLLRVGDEHLELELLWPGRFAIRPPLASRFVPRELHFGLGERARAGNAPTVRWVEGERDGSGWKEVEAHALASRIGGAVALAAQRARGVVAFPPEPPRAGAPELALREKVEPDSTPGSVRRGGSSIDRHGLPQEVRRLIGRWNE